MIYQASMDKFTKISTLLVIILILFIQLIPLYTTNAFREFQITFLFFSLLLIFITFGYSPRGYAILGEQLIIYRPFKNKVFGQDEVLSVELLDKDTMKWSMRIFGVAGLFGYFGLFRNTQFGTMVWYASRRDGFVLIRRSEGKPIVLTPDAPESFILEIQTKFLT